MMNSRNNYKTHINTKPGKSWSSNSRQPTAAAQRALHHATKGNSFKNQTNKVFDSEPL